MSVIVCFARAGKRGEAMTVDYETEYDNRGRVPEHPEILGRMAQAAPKFRAAALAAGRAELDVSYGPSARQIVDIFFPQKREGAPIAVFIHGGYWRALQPSAFSHLATGLNAHGVTLAMIGYDLAPQVGVGDIVDQVRNALLFLFKRLRQPMVVSGHSAGGHLTACMVATDWRKHGAPEMLVPAGYAISGLFDLEPMRHTAMNADFKLDEAEARRLSPLFWPAPRGKHLDAVVGGDESPEFLRQSRTIADTWGAAGVATRYEAVPGKNHFTIVEALAEPDSAMTKRILSLIQNQ